MARGIDHRSKETLMQAFEFNNKANWCIFSGTEPIVSYDDGDMEESTNRLQQYLGIIEQNPNRTNYILKTYPPGSKNITNKTPCSGSTTFNLNEDADVVKDPTTGLVIFNRSSPAAHAAPATNLVERMDKLETENNRLRDQLHKQELDSLRAEVTAKISGLNDKPDRIDRLIDMVIEKPEVISETLGKLIGYFLPEKKNYIHNSPIAGTREPEEPAQKIKIVMEDEVKHENNNEFADSYVKEEPDNDELTPEEEEALQDRQEVALEAIADRVGEEDLTSFLEDLATMSEEQLSELVAQQKSINTLRTRLQPAVLTNLVHQVAASTDKNLNKILNYLD